MPPLSVIDRPAIRYRFERGPVRTDSPFRRYAESAFAVVNTLPTAMPLFSFATSSAAPGGLLQSDLDPSGGAATDLRLRAIESTSGTLVERDYDERGSLIRVCYPDDQKVEYEWGPRGWLRGVVFEAGKRIEFGYDEIGLLRAVRYPGGLIFSYEFDEVGRLTRYAMPGREGTTFAYDGRGRLQECATAEGRFVLEWLEGDRPTSITYHTERGIYGGLTQASDEWDLPCVADDRTRAVVSGLGRWGYTDDGELESMTMANGCRVEALEKERRGTDVLRRIWSTLGQETYRSSAAGDLQSIVHREGTRTVFVPLPVERQLLAVGASSVSLCLVGSDGRLDSIRSDDGSYALVARDRAGRCTRMQTEQGTTRIARSRGGGSMRLRLPSGVSAILRSSGPGDRGLPSRLTATGTGADICDVAMELSESLWRLCVSLPLFGWPSFHGG